MRILIVSDYALPTGGVEHLIRALKSELVRRGHEVRIFSTSIGKSEGVNFADFHCFGSKRAVRTLLQTYNPFAVRALRQVLREFDPDIVHVRMFLTQLSPAILPLLRDYASVYHLAWYRAICPTGSKSLPSGQDCSVRWGTPCLSSGCVPIQDWPLRMLQLVGLEKRLAVFDRIVANSQFVSQRFLDEGIKTDVIHNGIEPPILAERANEAPERPTILFAGRLTPEKGCAILLQAFAELHRMRPAAQLVIAGDGPERMALVAAVARLRLERSVRFTGFLSTEELNRETRCAAVQVIPSIWHEPFGIAAIDAMMQAKPVIAARMGGLPEIVVHEETGYLYECRNVSALSAHLLSVVDHPARARAMGLAGRARAETRFSIGRCAADFEALYREIGHLTRRAG